MILAHTQYRSFLKGVLEDRRRKNGAYSMHAFARQLGISQSAVSQIFSGKKNFSQETALKVALSLGLGELETEYFCLLVQLESAKGVTLKENALRKLNAISERAPVRDLSLEFFRVISDWYYLVIRNMTELEGFEMSPKGIASRIGISALEAETALERLCRLELIEKIPGTQHRYRKTEGDILARAATPNEAIRNFHRQMLAKAQESLTTQTPQEKIVGSETFAFSERSLKEADAITEKYFRAMAALSKRPGKKTEVYHLGVQFFNVTKEQE